MIFFNIFKVDVNILVLLSLNNIFCIQFYCVMINGNSPQLRITYKSWTHKTIVNVTYYFSPIEVEKYTEKKTKLFNAD